MKLAYIIVYVQDVPQTVDFYEKAFGLSRRFVHESGQYAELETGTTALAFASEDLASGNGFEFQPNRGQSRPAGIEVGLVCDDVAVSFARALVERI